MSAEPIEPSRAELTYTRQPDNPAVLVADGHAVKISVSRGHLQVDDGMGRNRRHRRIPRMPCELSRLVILSPSGYITLDAIHWCAELGVAITQLDRDGRILMTSPGQAGDARLRIRQATESASPSGLSLGIIRDLTAAKVRGQADVLSSIFPAAADSIARIGHQIGEISRSDSLPGILASEGNAATAYFGAWSGNVHVPFRPADLRFAPAHWYTFTGRTSLRDRTRQGKNATDPVNALLNYAYAVCETEARLACHVAGLDPAMGFGHGQYRKTDSLVFDVMEPLRPLADRVILRMLDTGYGPPYDSTGRPAYFRVLDFCETSSGVCRLVAPVTHIIAEQVSAAVSRDAGRYASSVARALSDSATHKLSVPAARKSMPAVTRKVRVSPDTRPEDILPDAVWRHVASLLPPAPEMQSARHHTERADDRIILAGIMCHEILKSPWRSIPPSFGASWETCRRRLHEWERLGAWPQIRESVLNARSASSAG